MHVLVKASDKPRIENAKPRSRLDSIDGGEDGEEAVVKRLAASPFLRQARCGDGAVGSWKLLQRDGEVKLFFAHFQRFFRERFELDGLDSVSACTRVVIGPLRLFVEVVACRRGARRGAEVLKVLFVLVLE